jgi:Amt family ammonium transporter
MLTSTALVLMMTIPGLGLFYGGMVRKKNVLATVMQSFAITCLVTVLWMIVGYSLAFTDGSMNAYIGSVDKLFLHGVGTATVTVNALAASIPETVFITFQMTFAIITPALICGAFAERMKFSAMMWFMGLWLLFVYCPIAHWVWGGGFLGSAGVLDFAGGTVVHINAGVAGLVCALILGKRKGYGTVAMAPHNLTWSFIGASLLWVGWFGDLGQPARGCGDDQHPGCDRRRGAGLDVRRMDDTQEAERPRHHLRRGCRSGGHHAGFGFREPDRRVDHRHRCWRHLLHLRRPPQEGVRLR